MVKSNQIAIINIAKGLAYIVSVLLEFIKSLYDKKFSFCYDKQVRDIYVFYRRNCDNQASFDAKFPTTTFKEC